VKQRWQEFRCSPLGRILGIDIDCAPEAPPIVDTAVPAVPVAGLRALDRRVALALHGYAQPWLDWLMRRATNLASGQVTVPVALALVGWELRRGQRRSARAIAISWIGGLILHVTVKLIARRKRPALFPALTRAGGYSLPSGHTVTAVVTYGLAASAIVPILPRGWRWLPPAVATGVAGAVGTSRVYLGVHYPSDAVAGALIGLVWLRGSLEVLERIDLDYAGRINERLRLRTLLANRRRA
jgi:membrane-associated phospholipid phosphatase